MNADTINEVNDQLDALYEKEYETPHDAWQDVALVLEEAGIMIPILEEGVDEEMEFAVLDQNTGEDSGLNLYTAMDEEPNGKFRIFATLGDDNDMEALDGITEEFPEE